MSGYVHVPEVLHRCGLPDPNGFDDRWAQVGAVWWCSECDTYWRYGWTEDSWGPVWHQPFWRNLLKTLGIRLGHSTHSGGGR